VSSYLPVPGPGTHDAAEGGPSAVSVLVVDDDELKRYTLNRLLSPLGYRIVEADSGLAALRCLLVQDFAVILLDIRMPGMDGFEIAALIRARPRSRLTPIMLTTASTRAEIVASGLFGDKVADFMFAPIDSDEMRSTVAVFGNLFLKTQELAGQVQEAQASAERWRLLTDAAPVGIFETDCHHRYTHTNPRWSEITGVPAETALGQDWRTIVDADQASGLVELCVPGAESRIAVLHSKQVLDAAGGFAGLVGTLTDVTAVAQSRQAPSAPPDEGSTIPEKRLQFR